MIKGNLDELLSVWNQSGNANLFDLQIGDSQLTIRLDQGCRLFEYATIIREYIHRE
jgi:hypothetical protein